MRYILLSLLAPLALGAQQPKTLTLEEAILMAQRQGPSAQAARSTRDMARFRDRAFNARLMPQISLGGNAANLNRGIIPITAPDGSTQFVSQAQNQSSLGLQVAQKIPLSAMRYAAAASFAVFGILVLLDVDLGLGLGG